MKQIAALLVVALGFAPAARAQSVRQLQDAGSYSTDQVFDGAAGHRPKVPADDGERLAPAECRHGHERAGHAEHEGPIHDPDSRPPLPPPAAATENYSGFAYGFMQGESYPLVAMKTSAVAAPFGALLAVFFFPVSLLGGLITAAAGASGPVQVRPE